MREIIIINYIKLKNLEFFNDIIMVVKENNINKEKMSKYFKDKTLDNIDKTILNHFFKILSLELENNNLVYANTMNVITVNNNYLKFIQDYS